MQRRIVIAGSSGRMGRTLIEAVFSHPEAVLHGALERCGSEFIVTMPGCWLVNLAVC